MHRAFAVAFSHLIVPLIKASTSVIGRESKAAPPTLIAAALPCKQALSFFVSSWLADN
jgi:hypothetical protein